VPHEGTRRPHRDRSGEEPLSSGGIVPEPTYHPDMLRQILTTADARAVEAAANIVELRARAARAPAVRPLRDVLSRPGLSIIAEIKRRSPSAGSISDDLDPVALAIAYERGGADAISVLTEPHFFAGSLEDLEVVRDAVAVPVLRKDFTRHPAQVWEARASGADAVLLIVAALDQPTLATLIATAIDVGVDAVVEVHAIGEIDRAVEAGASIIGVNNRDLSTFSTDLSVAETAAPRLPDALVRIAESGVSDVGGASRMARAGYDAILVGEALVRHRDPAGLLADLKGSS
jgi:indole-3-glycerol phosphate synthase